MDNFTMSENSGSFGMQQRQDRFDAIGDLIVGPPGPPGPPGADGTVSFDELTPAQRESLRGEDGVSPAVSFTTITGGHTMTVTDKDHPSGQSINIMDGEDGSASMTILSYGNSTWADFLAAYNAKSLVYCRASSNADPATGIQGRFAFMAYVNLSNGTPTRVEFQYYRSVSTHSDSQQGDQVFVYALTNAGVWSVTVREAYTKIAAGSNMTSSYANGTLTLNATGGGGGTSDYDDLTDKPSINNVTLSGNKTAAELGLGTYSKPSGGIPKSDLASAVQTSLGKADSALQSVPSTYRTASAQDAIDATEVIVVNIASYSGSQVRVPASGTNAAITANHVLLASTVGTPVYQTGDWTVTTYDGYLTLSGSASAATTVKLILGKAGTTI